MSFLRLSHVLGECNTDARPAIGIDSLNRSGATFEVTVGLLHAVGDGRHNHLACLLGPVGFLSGICGLTIRELFRII